MMDNECWKHLVCSLEILKSMDKVGLVSEDLYLLLLEIKSTTYARTNLSQQWALESLRLQL